LIEHYQWRAIRQACRLLEKIDERPGAGEGTVYRMAQASAKILRSRLPQVVANKRPVELTFIRQKKQLFAVAGPMFLPTSEDFACRLAVLRRFA
jgi:hypothetical protein